MIICHVASLAAPAVLANPLGGPVAHGTATISESGAVLIVNQATDRAIGLRGGVDPGHGQPAKRDRRGDPGQRARAAGNVDRTARNAPTATAALSAGATAGVATVISLAAGAVTAGGSFDVAPTGNGIAVNGNVGPVTPRRSTPAPARARPVHARRRRRA